VSVDGTTAAGGTASPDGTWRLTLNTPIGKQEMTLVLAANGSALTGTASDDEGTLQADVTDGSADGAALRWKVAVTKPMPITLSFDATYDETAMTGTVKLGMFGTHPMTGTRT